MKGGPPFSQVWLDANDSPKFLDFVAGLVEVEHIVKKYQQAKILRIAYPRDLRELGLICSLKELETLGLMNKLEYRNEPKSTQIEASELLRGLQQLPKLKYLKLEASDVDLMLIKNGLPNCEVVPSSTFAPGTYR